MSQNLINSVKNTFKEYLDLLIEKMNNSRNDLSNKINELEEKTLNSTSDHYNNLNDIYQANKDTLNSYTIMIFEEIKSTVEANFQIFRDQIEFLNKNITSELNLKNNDFEDSFNNLKNNFNIDLQKFSENINKFFNEFKKMKISTAELLIEKIQTNIEIDELQAFSKTIEIIKNFKEEFFKEFTTLNQEIGKKFDNSINLFNQKFESINEKTQSTFTQITSNHNQNITTLKENIGNNLDKIIKEQTDLGEKYRNSYLKIMTSNINELNQELENFSKRASETHENYKKEIKDLRKIDQETINNFIESILRSEKQIKNLLETESLDASNDFKNEARNVLEIIRGIKNQNERYKLDLDKIHEKSFQSFTKNDNSLRNIFLKSQNVLKDEGSGIIKSFDKNLTKIIKESNAIVLNSKEKLFKKLDIETKSFYSFLETISNTISQIKKTNEGMLIKSLDELVTINESKFNEFSSRIEEDFINFNKNYENYIASNIENLQKTVSDIISEKTDINPLHFPEIDDLFNNIITLFDKYLKNSREKYQNLIQENFKSIFMSIDEIGMKFNQNISEFNDSQNQIFEKNQSHRNKLLELLKNSFESQFNEFKDRINGDLDSLLKANQEIIGKIMIKTAETGSEFYNKSEKTSKKSRETINGFISNINTLLQQLNLNFDQITTEIQEKIISKISEMK